MSKKLLLRPGWHQEVVWRSTNRCTCVHWIFKVDQHGQYPIYHIQSAWRLLVTDIETGSIYDSEPGLCHVVSSQFIPPMLNIFSRLPVVQPNAPQQWGKQRRGADGRGFSLGLGVTIEKRLRQFLPKWYIANGWPCTRGPREPGFPFILYKSALGRHSVLFGCRLSCWTTWDFILVYDTLSFDLSGWAGGKLGGNFLILN